MDSQLTLVEPPSADAVLVFDRANFRNFALHQRGFESHPLYVVRSNKDYTRTEVCDGLGAARAVIEYRSVLSDQITFVGQKPLRLNTWLKPTTSFPMVFEWQGEKYHWRTDQSDRLALYVDGAALSYPIAWYEHARRETNDNGEPLPVRPTPLSLRGVATDLAVRDVVVASFLVVLQRQLMSLKLYRDGEGRGRGQVG